jgi:hypothetical protein
MHSLSLENLEEREGWDDGNPQGIHAYRTQFLHLRTER